MESNQCPLSISLVSCKKILVLLLTGPTASPFSLRTLLSSCARMKRADSGRAARTQAEKKVRPAATQKRTRHEWEDFGTAVRFTTAEEGIRNDTICRHWIIYYLRASILRHNLPARRRTRILWFQRAHSPTL